MKSNAKALAFQNKMVADLRVDTGMNAMTVDGFIYQNERYLQGKASPEAFASQREALKGTYIFVDEMSMLSNEQVDKLTALGNLFDLGRSEEHTSELQSLMRISYAVFCLKKKNN